MNKTNLFPKIFLMICIPLVAILLILLGLHQNYIYKKHSQEPVSIIMATDMHYLSPDYRGEYFKEAQSIFDGKVIHYSNELLDAFLAEVVEKKPQVLILSGDLTLNGSAKSHEELIAKLQTIQNAGIDVLVIPGNHDVNSSSADYSQAEPQLVESLFSQGFSEAYYNFGPAQAIDRDENSFSYVYEVTPYLRIIMLDSNLDRKCWVKEDTLTWLESALQNAKSAGAEVITVTHQNLHIHNEKLYFSYQLYNADKLLKLYEKYDVVLNLSGHLHTQSMVTDSSVPEIVVPSLSICGTPYGELLYDGKSLTYTTVKTDVSSYAIENNFTDENLLDFNNYSYEYFEEVHRLQVISHFADTDISESELTLLADTFAGINAKYFVGDPISENDFAEGIALWRQYDDSFLAQYIETMLKEAGVDNRHLSIELQ